MSKKVWYVCYGSNLLEKRFLCYIKGGIMPGSLYGERGAKNQRLPERIEPCIIHHELFFAYNIPKWNGSGVAFIDSNFSDQACTYAKKYLIEEEQFWDVVRQENGIEENVPIEIDYNELKKNGSMVIFKDKLYGKIVYFGDADEIPMYSFTCFPASEEINKMPLYGPYYEVISDGLKETYNFSDQEIEEYLRKYK